MNSLPQDIINEIATYSQYPTRKILGTGTYSRYKPTFEALDRLEFDIIMKEEPELITSGHVALIVDDIFTAELPDIRPLVIVSRCLNDKRTSLKRLQKFLGCGKFFGNGTSDFQLLGGSKGVFGIKDGLLVVPSCCLEQHYGMILNADFPITSTLMIPFLCSMKLISYTVIASESKGAQDVVHEMIGNIPTLKYINYMSIFTDDELISKDIFTIFRLNTGNYLLGHRGTKTEYNFESRRGQHLLFVDYWLNERMVKIPDGTCIPTIRYDDRITPDVVQMLEQRGVSILQLEFKEDQDVEHVFPICKIVVLPESYSVRGWYPHVRTIVVSSIDEGRRLSRSFPNARCVIQRI